MPEISRFFGIIVRMFVEIEERHSLPHFHAYYQEHMAIFDIETIEILAGSFPKRQRRFIEAWAELHQSELLRDWNALQEGNLPVKIAPLR